MTCLQGHCDVVSSLVIYKNHYLISTDLSSLIVVVDLNREMILRFGRLMKDLTNSMKSHCIQIVFIVVLF